MKPDELRQRIEYFNDLGVRICIGVSASARALRSNPVAAPEFRHVVTPRSRSRSVGDTLVQISQDIGDCTRCGLHKGRNKIVFGDG